MTEEKECAWFYKMRVDHSQGKHAKTFYLAFTTIEDGQFDYVNFDKIEKRCHEIFKFLKINNRFNKLLEEANGNLSCWIDGFELKNFKFDTLDEVEKALKNKAFL